MANEIDLKRLGHKIRFIRQGRGWSLSDLAANSGVSKAYISDLENGVAGKPNIQYVYSVAKGLDTTLDRLLGEESVPTEALNAPSASDLPAGLAELQSELHLSEEDLQTLASLNFRGHRPKDKDSWRYLLETLRMLSQRRPQ